MRVVSGLIGIILIVLGISTSLALSEIFARVWTARQTDLAILDSINVAPSEKNNSVHILVIGESSAGGGRYYPKADPGAIAVTYLNGVLPEYSFHREVLHWGGATLPVLFESMKKAGTIKRPSILAAIVGHNNFLSAFGSHSGCSENYSFYLDWLIGKSALARLLIKRVQQTQIGDSPSKFERSFFDVPVACPLRWHEVLADFETHLRQLSHFANRNKIPMIVFIPAGNEGDANPTRSVFQGRSSERSRFHTFYTWGRHLFHKESFEEAVGCFEEAKTIDPSYAENLYWLGKAYAKIGRIEAARENFRQSKDRDGFPWRALTAQVEIAQRVAKEEGFVAVDVRDLLLAEHPKTLLGADLFCDRHHADLSTWHSIGFELAKATAGSLKSESVPHFNKMSDKEIAIRHGITKKEIFSLFTAAIDWHQRVSGFVFDELPTLQTIIEYIKALSVVSQRSPKQAFGSYYDEVCNRCQKIFDSLSVVPSQTIENSRCGIAAKRHSQTDADKRCCPGENSDMRVDMFNDRYPWLADIPD